MNLIQSIGRILRPAPKVPVQMVNVFEGLTYPQWIRIQDIWYHPTYPTFGKWEEADIVIAKWPDGVFKYIKHRGDGLCLEQPLNEAELKEMAWIILSAEKA